MRKNYTTEIIKFHKDEITVLVTKNGKRLVAMKPIVERFGLDWSGQLQRMKRDLALSEGMVIIPIPTGSGLQDMVFLDYDFLNGWLFKVQINRVKEEFKPALILYQKECFKALRDYFQRKQFDWQEARALGKVSRKSLTDVINERSNSNFVYKNVTDAINKPTIGMNAKQYRELHGLDKKANVREHLDAETLRIFDAIEQDTAQLIVDKDAQGTKQMMVCAEFVAERRLETSKLSKQLVLPEKRVKNA